LEVEDRGKTRPLECERAKKANTNKQTGCRHLLQLLERALPDFDLTLVRKRRRTVTAREGFQLLRHNCAKRSEGRGEKVRTSPRAYDGRREDVR
jgi:hypothetical protein